MHFVRRSKRKEEKTEGKRRGETKKWRVDAGVLSIQSGLEYKRSWENEAVGPEEKKSTRQRRRG